MTLPVYLHSAMPGAPVLSGTNGSINALLNACLVNGFNTQSATSATASEGVVTFNFASAPGVAALDAVTIAGASNSAVNGQKRVQSAASNQVLVAIPGVPDGAVGGTITLKISPLGWTRPYAGTNLGVYRQGGSSTTKRYLRVYDGALTSTGVYNPRGYEAMTAVSTGSGPFPTAAQAAGNGVDMYGPAPALSNKPWVVVGTPRAFYMLTAYGNAYSAGDPLSVSDTYQFFFGDLDRVQKLGDTYACAIAASAAFPGGGGAVVLPRPHSATAGAVYADLLSPTGANTSYRTQAAEFPDAATGGFTLGDAWAVMQTSPASVLRGFMPGLLSVWQNIGTSDALMRPAQITSNVQGLSGRVLATCSAGHPYTGGMLLLDEDWGDA